MDAPLPTCAIHGDAVAEIGCYCPSCRRWFCEDCVRFYIQETKACPACGMAIDPSAFPQYARPTA
jgi:hydrogenase maturation factor HypF (carbamoyltransferase family)